MSNGETFILGVIVGMLFLFAISFLPLSVEYKYYAAIDACEEGLPRNQNCVINAIPDVPNNGVKK